MSKQAEKDYELDLFYQDDDDYCLLKVKSGESGESELSEPDDKNVE